MSEGGRLPEHDARAVGRLRAFLRAPDEANRNGLAAACLPYIRAFAHARRTRRRFGFDRPFHEIVDDVADWEVALLLPGPASSRGPMAVTQLVRRLVGCPRWSGSEEEVRRRLLALDDTTLALDLRRVLGLLADQGLTRQWKREHRDERLLLRSLKLCLSRGSAGIWIDRSRLGQFIVTEASDVRLEPIRSDELAESLRACGPRFEPRRIVSLLRSLLRPAGDHGGYCYLLDVVRVVHALRTSLVERDGAGTGAIPAGVGPARSGDGIPLEVWAGKAQRIFLSMAREIQARDAEKAAREPQAPDVQDAIAQIAVEKVVRSFGLGRREWAGLAQAKLTRMLIPDAKRDGGPDRYQNEIDYMVRRLRGLISARRETLVRSLWHQWLRATGAR